MKRICIIYNFAQHYRTRIFQLLDQEFECSFFFGKTYLDVKKMDYTMLKGDVHEVKTIKLGPIIYRIGVIKQLFKKYDAYIILGESRVASTWLFLLISRLFLRKKVYSWTHGWYGKERGILKILNKILLRLPSGGNFFYGNYGKNLAIKEGINPKKQFVIHNSLAYEEQLSIRNSLNKSDIYVKRFHNENPVLIFVGRLTAIKRLDLLIQALGICKKKNQLFNLIIVGDGEMKSKLTTISNEMNLQNHIWFFGDCYEERMLGQLIYNADICVSPGNVGLTALHAMVYGCPVITHNNFPMQMPEFETIIEGKTGSFFNYNDSSSLAESIVKWNSKKREVREFVRFECMHIIDSYWTPKYQIELFKKVLDD